MEFKHKPVMLNECISGLNIKPDGIYVDGTLGGAGHSREISKRLSNKGLLIGIDRDEDALHAAKQNLKEFQNVKFIKDNHDNRNLSYDEARKKLNSNPDPSNQMIMDILNQLATE